MNALLLQILKAYLILCGTMIAASTIYGAYSIMKYLLSFMTP